jgi:hypothetical protein
MSRSAPARRCFSSARATACVNLRRLDRDRLITLPGDQHDGAWQVTIRRGGDQEFKSGHVRQIEFQQHAIELVRLQRRKTGRAIHRKLYVAGVRVRFGQQFAIVPPIDGVVVNDQHTVDTHQAP